MRKRKKKLWNMKVTVIPIVNDVLSKVVKEFGTRIKRHGNERMKRDHRNYTIIKIGQNTQKRPGDLMGLAVTQTPVKNHQLTLM